MRSCGDDLGMPICTEVMDTRQVELIERYTDMFQIGARNMQNFDLLREVGKTRKPVLLKRGLAATVKDWLLSAEYILALDITSISVLQHLSHLPIIVDPSHCAGVRQHVPSVALAGMAAGAHGVIIEVHYCPSEAQCDGPQALLPETFANLIPKLKVAASIHGKTFEETPTPVAASAALWDGEKE
jgi:3-deoxy-7-phosphoheptulonate synthase